MVDGLNDHVIDGIGAFFASDFRWMGNAGCGTKNGLSEFQDNWQRPFQAAFSDKVCIDEARIAEGEWMAAFGRQEATHSGEFMGIAPTGKRVEIRYMDFWKVTTARSSTTGSWSTSLTSCASSASTPSAATAGKNTTRAAESRRDRLKALGRAHGCDGGSWSSPGQSRPAGLGFLILESP